MKVTKRIIAVAGVGTLSLASLHGTATVRAADAEPADNLTEVVVTAQRREQRLQDVPVAVSVVTGADLQKQSIQSLEDISDHLADVKIESGTLTNSMNIRGVGSGNNSGFEQSVATFEDGVYRPRSRSTSADLFDVDQVEVLKGPQTTFFGANAIAGALNITTRKPGDTFGYNGSLGYEFEAHEYDAEGGVNLPVADGLSVRLAARVSGMQGYVRMLDDASGTYGPDDSNKLGRISVRWQPGDIFESNFRLDAEHQSANNAEPLEVTGCPPGAAYPAPLPPPAGGAPTTCALSLLQNGNIKTTNFNSDSPPSWSLYDFAEAAWNNSWKLPAGVITSITSYFEHTANNRTQLIPLSFPNFTTDGYDPLPSNVLEHYHQFTQEVRFQSNLGSRFDYMFGAYYSHDTLVNTSGTGFYFAPFGAILSGPPFDVAGVGPTDAITGIPRLGETDHTISGFASATIHATDQLRLNLGGRYSQITKDGSHSLTFGTSVNNTDGTFVPWPNASLQLAQCVILTCDNNQFSPSHLVESKFMPSAGLQYDIVPNLMSYLTYTNGFKAGGFSGAATSNTFGPESVNAFELGTKGTFLDRSLTVDADVFYMHYNNLQETSYTQTLAAIVVNAAESKSQGVELDGTWRASRYLVLRANLARLDAVYEDFLNGPCTSLQNLTATCGTGQNMNGKTRPYSPKWSGDVGATVTVPVGAYELRIDPSVYFSSMYFETDAADPLLSQGGYAMYDLRFAFAPPDSRWEVALLGKNLGNRDVYSFMLEMPGSPGSVEALPERSRYIGLQVSFHN